MQIIEIIVILVIVIVIVSLTRGRNIILYINIQYYITLYILILTIL